MNSAEKRKKKRRKQKEKLRKKEEKKKAKIERKLAKKQGKAKDKRNTLLFKLKKKWRNRNMLEMDMDTTKLADPNMIPASSDPYLVIKLGKPFPTPLNLKVFRKGGYRGRKVRTHTCYQTLYPVWGDIKRPLVYFGMRNELENEMLRLSVYDHDFMSKLQV